MPTLKLRLSVRHVGGFDPVALIPGKVLPYHAFSLDPKTATHFLDLDPADPTYTTLRDDILGVINRPYPIFADPVLVEAAPAPVPPPPAAPTSEKMLEELAQAGESDTPADSTPKQEEEGEPAAPPAKAPVVTDDPTRLDYTSSGLKDMTVEELRALATARGFKFTKRDKEAALVEKHLEWQKANL